jgi:hypothetical protein
MGSKSDDEPPSQSRILWDPDADEAMERLESTPALTQLLAVTRSVLSVIEEDPGRAEVRRHRFSNGLWAIALFGSGEEWLLLWEPNLSDADEVVIRYLGPAPGGGPPPG